MAQMSVVRCSGEKYDSLICILKVSGSFHTLYSPLFSHLLMAMAMNPENMSYDDFKEIVDGLCCRAIPPLVMPEVPPGCFTLASFPMVEMENENNHVVHFFDIIADHPGEIDYFALSTAYKNACERKDLELLPEPFGLKGKCPNDTTIQIVLLKQADGKTTILKHLSFPEKIKTPMLMKMIFGIPFKPRFMAANPKVGRKILQYCLENLGGRAFTCFDLTSQATRKAANKSNISLEDKDDAEIDQGFDHILRKAPRTTSEMQQLRWQTKELRCKDSPIFGWPPALVTQALRHVSSDGALARKEVAWPIPLTSDYYEPSILQILEKIWDFDQSALILLGEPGCGKSPLGRSILMAQARHNQSRFNLDGQVCVRCTPELDFLRGEPGSVLMGDFLDDTSLNILDMKLVKAFLDVGLYESMAWARWGASKWVQNQPRAVADNTYDAELELPYDFLDHVTFENFYKLVRPAFKDSASRAHMDAIFKRAAFILSTKTHVYYRAAGINTNPVYRIAIFPEGFLTEAGRHLYGEYKAGQKELPPRFEEQVFKEQEWVSLLMENRFKERKANKNEEQMRHGIRAQVFGDKPPSKEDALEIVENRQSNRAAVKREIFEENQASFFKRAKTFSHLISQEPGACIDLDSDSDKENGTSASSMPPKLGPQNPEWDIGPGDEEGLGHGGDLFEDEE